MLVQTLSLLTMQYTAPPPPDSARELMPVETESFGQGLWTVIKNATEELSPSISEAAAICVSLIAVVLVLSILNTYTSSPTKIAQFVGSLAIATILLKPSNALIHMGADTVTQMSEYGKLLLPVMTASLAAQGGLTSSAALYTGTALFDAILSTVVKSVLVPAIYIYIAFCVANSAIGETALDRICKLIKWFMTWVLKIVLYVFTGYISITGVVSGTADASAVKAAKLAISGAVPVVGNILSDASETILISAGVMKSTAGITGLLTIISVWIGPFLKIGVQYMLLKLTAAVCSVFGDKKSLCLLQDFSGAMGVLLAMTGTMCLLLLVSTVCFMKGIQ